MSLLMFYPIVEFPVEYSFSKIFDIWKHLANMRICAAEGTLLVLHSDDERVAIIKT